MAHVWLRTPAATDEWTACPLDNDAFDLAGPAGRGEARARLVRDERHDAWAVIADDPEVVWINGLPPLAGIQILADRDELCLAGGERLYFSAEDRARIEPFPGADTETPCGRCRQPIPAGASAVRCPRPRCRVWHHETTDLPCWTYAETCSQCAQKTSLDAGPQWVPECD
jgi:hypothetical protein